MEVTAESEGEVDEHFEPAGVVAGQAEDVRDSVAGQVAALSVVDAFAAYHALGPSLLAAAVKLSSADSVQGDESLKSLDPFGR